MKACVGVNEQALASIASALTTASSTDTALHATLATAVPHILPKFLTAKVTSLSSDQLEILGLSAGSQGQNLAVTVLYVPYSLDSGPASPDGADPHAFV